MPLTDPNDVTRTAAHWRGQSTDFSSVLAAAFDGCLDAIDLTDAEAALAVLALHGQGRESGTGLNLQASSGLVVKITDGVAWILGRRIAVTTTDTFTLWPIPANAETWVYMDDDGDFHNAAAELTGVDLPTDYVCLGTATTDSSDCTSVDMTDADIISSIADVAAEIDAIDALILAIRGAIGEEYFGSSVPAKSLNDRIDDIVTSGGTVYGETMEWSSTDSRLLGTVIQDLIDASLVSHIATYHTGGTGDDDGPVIVPSYWDWMVINLHLGGIQITDFTDPDYPASQQAAVYIVWGAYGNGENGTPDFVHASSTWTP